MPNIPITDTIVHAFSQLVDDSGNGGSYREPSHSDIEFQINTFGLANFDPKQQGQLIGKAKRVRAVLYEAMTANPIAASGFAMGLLGKIRACGGFRAGAPNFVGLDAIANAKTACESVGFVLADDGALSPKVLTALNGPELTDALLSYARRAQRGAEDAALVAGTGKDLLEATAAHVLMTIRGSYPAGANFQALLGMAFVALGLAVPEMPEVQGESPIRAMERGLFLTALGVNRVRNKQGSGHGRPWLPTLTDAEAKAAIESVGTVASYLLAKLAINVR
ncbi:hypothetical protein BSZ31_15130 [Limnobacter sp. SAORIC-690]|uniref:abortive infection family protein n=1 Tax=Limnobacter sp. SAORIC-690 TaxID=1923970 RepID=UPI000CF561B9|nr:abortive infection family protein [Limnobacter sp. SAORIC-690]PQJ26080.1 hypothetical protein BSZ31_15130 [Limnobacter sp. SAORIC-690]|tara:strand:- start:832 stop:1668 length:837 start_codon:yes stop_codon:yes gene_type:complete